MASTHQFLARTHAAVMSSRKVAAVLTASLTWSWLLVCGQALAQSADAAPHLPDMSAYNCTAATSNATASTRHIGQVIKGRYYEWHEIYIQGQTNQQRLACISLVRPTTQQLNSDEAKTFLTNAFAIGAPAATATDREASQSTGSIEPPNVQAEPIKRLRQPSAASSSGAEQKAAITDLPPVPASKSFDGPSGTTASTGLSSRERSAVVQESPASALDVAKAQTVGVEDRTQIPNTQVFPWTTLAYLSVTYPNGDSFRCSATLVSPYVVVTAGHCVHNNTRGGYITSARVYPGQSQATLGDNNPIRPYGSKSDVSAVQTTSQWTQISGDDSYQIASYRHDFAAIQFKTAFTHTSTFMPILYANTASPVTSAGYPATYKSTSAFGLYAETGSESNQSFNDLRAVHVREFKIDASAGNSGGPFFYIDSGTGQRYLVGSLSYADDLDDQAGGPWYDSWNQSLVSGWASWTPSNAVAGTVSGLRVASVFSSTLQGATSYLRFYNAGTASGSVDVTLADYATGAILGTWTSPVIAGHRTRQFAVSEIESGANAVFTKPSVYSISVRPTFSGIFQNTLWNTGSATLANASTCDTPSADQKTLIYVHSSLLAPYTSTVVIHNTGTSAVSPTLGIYNAETGLRITGYVSNAIPANGQNIVEVASLEKAAGITPSTAYHYNIVAETSFTGYLQQFLNNQTAKTIVDMTASCAMGP